MSSSASLNNKHRPQRTAALLLYLAAALAAADGRALFEKARALQQAGDWTAAEATWRAYLEQNQASAEALGNLGAVLSHQGKYEEASGAYQRALRLRPALAPLHLNLGLALYKAGKPTLAIEQFQIYLKTDPSHRQARQLLATVLLESGRFAEAARHFESLMPTQEFSLRLGLATAYVRLDRRSEAQRILEALEQKEDSAEVQLVLGQAYMAENDFDQAERSFRRALEIDPSLRGVHFHLGASRWKQQDERQAIEEWREEVMRDPANFDALFALGAALAEKGDPGEAVKFLAKARGMRPAHGPTLYYLGKLAWKERRPDALELLKHSVAADPDNRAAHYLLAQVYRVLGRTRDAENELVIVRRLSQAHVLQDEDIVQGAKAALR